MSIASQITALTTDRNNIRTALVNKGVSAASSHGFDSFATDIANIPSGGGGGFYVTNPLCGGTTFMTGSSATRDFTLSEAVGCAFMLLPCNGWYSPNGSTASTSATNTSFMGYGYGRSAWGTTGKIDTHSPSPETWFKDGSGSTSIITYTAVKCGGMQGSTLTLSRISDTKYRLTKTADTWNGYPVSYCSPVILVFESFDQESKYAFDVVNLGGIWGCFAADTEITLENGMRKLARDIEYTDILSSVDFDFGMYSWTKPLWIKTIQTAPRYQLCKFRSGRTLKLVGPEDGKCHRMYCMESASFEYAPDVVGKHVLLDVGGSDILESWEWVEEPIEYTNIVGNFNMCIFTNGILTSCRQNNIYPISEAKYVKDDRVPRPKKAYDSRIPKEFYDGLRLSEQTAPIEEINAYVLNMLEGMKHE